MLKSLAEEDEEVEDENVERLFDEENIYAINLIHEQWEESGDKSEPEETSGTAASALAPVPAVNVDPFQKK